MIVYVEYCGLCYTRSYVEEEYCACCGALEDDFHEVGCELELCPICGQELIYCEHGDLFFR